ncbi:hypothetical protein [Streptomyces mirabilis]
MPARAWRSASAAPEPLRRPESGDRHHGGPISRRYATGEITEETVPALSVLSTDFDDEGNDEESERIFDVIHYVVEAGERPQVSGWVGKLWQPGRGEPAR